MRTTTRVFLPCALLLALPGCAQVLGFDDVQPVQELDVADAALTLPTFDAAPDSLACAQQEFSPAIGTATGSNETSENERDQSCGTADSNDLLLGWRAPVTDYYVFSTAGSDFDTVLGLYNGCEGEEFACSNNVEGESTSEIVVKLQQDAEVVVAVDGFAADTGNVALAVERVSCPDSDLEGQTLPLALTTGGFGDDFSNSCGGDGQEDRAYHYVAPADGLYAFTAIGETHEPIITVIDGSRCEDQELGCSRASEPGTKSEIVRRLTEGQSVSVYLDGRDGAGPFSLDIQTIEATCPAGTLEVGNMLIGFFESRTMSSSCSFPEGRNSVNIVEELNDATFQVNLDNAGTGCIGSCQIVISAGGPFSAALLEGGDCSGVERECHQSTANAATIDLTMDETEARTHTLVISDAAHGEDNGFQVSMECGVACF